MLPREFLKEEAWEQVNFKDKARQGACLISTGTKDLVSITWQLKSGPKESLKMNSKSATYARRADTLRKTASTESADFSMINSVKIMELIITPAFQAS